MDVTDFPRSALSLRRIACFRRVAIALFAAASIAGCEPAPARIVVVVSSDLEIPRELEELLIEVDATPIGGDVRSRIAALDTTGALPLVLVVHHEGGRLGPIVVRAIGRRDGDDVVTRTARLSFGAERSVVLRLDLMRACLGSACDDGATCEEGACISANVEVDTLPSWTGRDDGGAPASSDGGVDTTRADGSAMCPAACACVQRCAPGAGCECVAGCGCVLSCAPGQDCTAPRCDGPGTACVIDGAGTSNFAASCDHMASCAIDVRGASNATGMECRHGATCDVDCTGASNCRLSCDSDSPCLLRCGATSNCELACEAIQSCAGGIKVCNRDCP